MLFYERSHICSIPKTASSIICVSSTDAYNVSAFLWLMLILLHIFGFYPLTRWCRVWRYLSLWCTIYYDSALGNFIGIALNKYLYCGQMA